MRPAQRKRQNRAAINCNIRRAACKDQAKKQCHLHRREACQSGNAFSERRTAMKTTILAASAALILTTAAASAAEPGSWSTHWTGPHGGVYEGSGKCADGARQS